MDYIIIDANNSSGAYHKIKVVPRRKRQHTFLFTVAGELVEATSDPCEGEDRLNNLTPDQRKNLEKAYRRAFGKPFDWAEYGVTDGEKPTICSKIELAPGEPEISLVMEDVYRLPSCSKERAFIISGNHVKLVEYKSLVIGYPPEGVSAVWAGSKQDFVRVHKDGSLVNERCLPNLKGRPNVVGALVAAHAAVFGNEKAVCVRPLLEAAAGLTANP